MARIILFLPFFEYNAKNFIKGLHYMDILAQLFPFVILLGIMYFIIIRPQRQQEKKHQEMINELKKGDKIVTIGGVIVEVKKVEEAFFVVKMNDNTEVKLVKEAVNRKYGDEA